MSATGDYIREARGQKGLTLGQVEEATNIPRYYLEILEGGGDDRLVSDRLYMVHFLRGYAAFLEVEVETLAAQFVRENRHIGTVVTIPARRGRSWTGILVLALAVLLGAGAGVYVFAPTLLDIRWTEGDPLVVVSTATPTPANKPVPVTAPTPETDHGNSSVLQPEADETTPSKPRLVTTPPPEANPADTAQPEPATPQPVTATQEPSTSTAAQETSVSTIPGPPDAGTQPADQQARLSTVAATATADPDTSEPRQPLPDSGGDETGNPAAPETAAVTAVSEPPATSEADVPGTYNLTIAADQRSWLRVWIDDGQPRDMLLDPGESRTLSAETGFVITFGNAGGVRLSLNGQDLPPAGTSGQVVRNFKVPTDRQDIPR